MKASRWEPVEDETELQKSRWEKEENEDEQIPKSKWEREEDNGTKNKWSKEDSQSSKWQRVSDSPKDRLVYEIENIYEKTFKDLAHSCSWISFELISVSF